MNDIKNDKNSKTDLMENLKQKSENPETPIRKTQMQLLQEALGIKPTDIKELEKNLFITRFIDYFSEETFDFIYKDRSIMQYRSEVEKHLKVLSDKSEENKLLIKSYEDKRIVEIIYRLKGRAEFTAISKGGIKTPIDKRVRLISATATLPIILVSMILLLMSFDSISSLNIIIIIPLLCLFCFIPTVLRRTLLVKWYKFKDENKNSFYLKNREDIKILKSFAGDVLNNLRTRLLEMKVPLQLIKFVLHSRDYDNLNLIQEQSVRGVPQYLFSFEYPPDMEPFPIPELLLQEQQRMVSGRKSSQEPEVNFIVLINVEGKNGVLTNFSPCLKVDLADKINNLLNNCDFAIAPNDFSQIIPNYKQLPIYCTCGEIAEFLNIHICNWKNQFKFYLFEAKECQCGEKMYVISLMDESDEIPQKLRKIFSN
ncbi:MAG: hypothetical protein ACFFAN_10190 [Promethearchaeota archaeon]